MRKKKRAFSYIRMSTDVQLKGHSLERQLQLTRDYADKHGFELVEDIRDIGLSAHSGANVKKGKLGEFLQALDNGEIEKDCVLLVESLDRLSRKSPRQAFNQFNNILNYGIEVHTIFDNQIYTSESVDQNPGQLFSSIGYMLRAFSESEEKSKRLKRKWQNKRDNIDQKLLTSICPAWLKIDKEKAKFEIIPERLKTVQKIFDLYLDQDMGAYSIARYLNENLNKYPTFSNPSKKQPRWHKSYILKILNNPAVHGEFIPHVMIDGKRAPAHEIIENYFPVAIPEKRFLLAQAKKKQRTISGGGRKGDTFGNVFTKLLICNHCGSKLNFFNKGKPPKGGKYLRCSNAEYKHACKAPAWRYDEFKESFFSFVAEPEFEQLIKKGNYQSRKSKLLDEKISIEQKIEKLDKKLNSIVDSMDEMTASTKKRVNKRLEDISSELDQHEEKLSDTKQKLLTLDTQNSQKTHDEIIKIIKEQEKELNDIEKTELRRRTHSLIKKVIHKITIHNLLPTFHPASGVINNFSPRVIKFLLQEGAKNEEEIIEMFSGPQGNQSFQKAERYYVIHFHNGQKRTVHPFIEKTWKLDEARFIEFKENVEEKKKRTQAKERIKKTKYKRRKNKKN